MEFQWRQTFLQLSFFKDIWSTTVFRIKNNEYSWGRTNLTAALGIQREENNLYKTNFSLWQMGIFRQCI